MAIRIGINGFGRIGRQVYRAIRERYDKAIDVVAVNDIGRINIMAHLLKYDSTYGQFPGDVVPREDGFVANGDEVQVLAERDPARLPWASWTSILLLNQRASSANERRHNCISMRVRKK